MGYTSSGQQSLILDGPVELDKVTIVARDCLLAYVECQVGTVTINLFRQIPCEKSSATEIEVFHDETILNMCDKITFIFARLILTSQCTS